MRMEGSLVMDRLDVVGERLYSETRRARGLRSGRRVKNDFRSRRHAAYWAFILHRVSGVALALYCLIIEWVGVFSFLVCWFALSATVALIAKNLDRPED